MRVNLTPDGQCRVLHVWFNNIFELLEHYRIEVIPLESGLGSDVRLTSFVVKNEDLSSSEVMTYNGSVRIRTDLLNIGQNGQLQQRAKENSYSFI